MSGTSLDCVDAAVLVTDGQDITVFGPTQYRRYTDAEQTVLSAALGHWPGPEVEAATSVVAAVHAEALAKFEGIDLVGLHGQTLAHTPRKQGTLQVDDGAALAEHLMTPIVWNFRISDVELGGEVSPLASFFHHACALYIKAEGPIVFLNLGGMGNITWVDPAIDATAEVGALLAFDTGPANAPINDLVQARCDVAFDKNCKIASLGTLEMGVLELFLAEPYFPRVPQKSLDKNDFYKMINLVKELSDPDATATLTAMCAAGVAEAMQHCPRPPSKVLVTGGGRKNPVLMKMLEVSL